MEIFAQVKVMLHNYLKLLCEVAVDEPEQMWANFWKVVEIQVQKLKMLWRLDTFLELVKVQNFETNRVTTQNNLSSRFCVQTWAINRNATTNSYEQFLWRKNSLCFFTTAFEDNADVLRQVFDELVIINLFQSYAKFQ